MAPKHPSQSEQKRGVPAHVSRPAEFKRAIRGFQAGKTFKEISASTGFSVSTLQNIKKDNKEIIAAKQEQALDKMLDVREMALSRLEREIDDVPLASLPVTIGILSDKVRDLTGGNVSTVAHISVKLPEEVKEGTVIDLLPTANSCEQNTDQPQLPENKGERNGSQNRRAGFEAGAGGIDRGATDDPVTHKNGENFFGKGKPDVETADSDELTEVQRENTGGSEGTVKPSTEGGGTSSSLKPFGKDERIQI